MSCRCRTAWSTSGSSDEVGGRGGRQEVPLLLPGRDVDVDGADQRNAARRRPGEPAAPLRHARPSCTRWPTRTRCWRCGANSAIGMITALRPDRGPADGRDRQQPAPPAAARSTPTPPTRPRASCSCATPSTSRVLSLIDTPGHHGRARTRRTTALVRHCTRLFNVGANLTVPLFTVVLRKAYGLGAQAMAGRQLRSRRSSRSPGRPASSPA